MHSLAGLAPPRGRLAAGMARQPPPRQSAKSKAEVLAAEHMWSAAADTASAADTAEDRREDSLATNYKKVKSEQDRRT